MTRWPLFLVVLCTLLQIAAWQAGWRSDGHETAARLLGMAEMVLMLGLLAHGWSVHQRVAKSPHASMALLAAQVSPQMAARWGLTSLALCTLGDLINRNFDGKTFAYDTIIEHSYLADSVWCFLPGYLVWVGLAWRVSSPSVSVFTKCITGLAAGLAGLASWHALVPVGAHPYTLTLTGAYSVVITAMVAAAAWLHWRFGWRAWPVVAGAVLATLADALIAQFWLFGNGYYPGIAHLNFVVYFASQSLLQQLPLVMSQAGTEREAR